MRELGPNNYFTVASSNMEPRTFGFDTHRLDSIREAWDKATDCKGWYVKNHVGEEPKIVSWRSVYFKGPWDFCQVTDA